MFVCFIQSGANGYGLVFKATMFFLLLVVVPLKAVAHPDLILQIEELSEQLEQQPDNVNLLLKRGDLYRRHQSWDLAHLDFKQVREIQPENRTVDWFEGRLDVESGQPAEGIQYLDRFLSLNPGHSIALQNRAQGYLLVHQPLLAAQDFAMVIQVSDRPAPSLFSANALAFVAAGSDNWSAAMEVVQNGLVLFPSEIMLTSIGTDISLARSDTENAEEFINRLPASIQDLQQWQIRKVLLGCQAGQYDKTAHWFTARNESGSPPRHTWPLLSQHWLALLASSPSPENCQAAAVEILQNH